MLNLSDIAIRRGSRLLFEGASLQLHAGQRLGLIGANGSGKSSLLAMIMGELEPDAGEFHLQQDTQISHVAQESPGGTRTAIDHVMDGDEELRSLQLAISEAEKAGQPPHGEDYARLEAIDGFAAEARAARLLVGLGFSDDEFSRPVGEFSGGWRMRLNLARALMCRSDLLLLDEPTNHLDLPAILWLEKWLCRYPGMLLLISHDRDFLDSVCTRTASIEQGRLRLYNGNYSQFERQRSEQLAQQEALYKRQQKEISHMQSYVDRFRYKASKAKQAQSRLKMLERMTVIAPAHVDSPFRFHFMEPEKQPHHLAQLEDVVAGYEDPVLSDVNLLVSAGDRLGLLGVNGAGKSTLVKALADGSTLLTGERIVSKDTRIGYFAQHQLDLLDPESSPYDHLARVEPGERESDRRKYLGRFGFGDERIFEPVAPLSGGEKARLVLALMIRRRPNLLLLDEPTNHLDLDMRQALSQALVEYNGALVVISHDRHLIRSVCDELVIINDGGVTRFSGSIDDYPQWLQDQEESGPEKPRQSTRPNRKQQRQAEAQLRQQTKPLRDRLRKVEQRMEQVHTGLNRLESLLADADLYTDASRKQELTQSLCEQAELKQELSDLEWKWLEASEALENASARARVTP